MVNRSQNRERVTEALNKLRATLIQPNDTVPVFTYCKEQLYGDPG